MSHAVVNVDVSENSPTVRKSPFSQSVGVWVDMDVSLHFRDAGHLGEWLAAACEGLSALLDPEPVPDEPQLLSCCTSSAGCAHRVPPGVNPCSGSAMPDRQGEVEG